VVVIAAQELGDFEFDRFLKHELIAQGDGFRQWRLPCGRAEELFFEVLLGVDVSWLSFAFCLTGAVGVCIELVFTGSLVRTSPLVERRAPRLLPGRVPRTA
jgi:hypothetical protein